MSEIKCPYFKECGGCTRITEPYEKELLDKKKYLENLFKKINYKKPIEVISNDNCYNYRNKVIVAPKLSKSCKVVSGIYQEHSHKIITVSDCLIQNKPINEAIKVIEEVLTKNKILPFENGGFLKHILFRYGNQTNELMIVFVTMSDMFPGRNNVVKELVNRLPNLKTIVQNIQNRNTPIVLGDKERILYGSGFVYDVLCGLKFKISSKSFYQINHDQTEKLYSKALSLAKLNKDDILLDSYSGIGTIGMVASKKVRKVISVEKNHDAYFDAKENAKINNIKNIEFYCDDSTKFLLNLAENRGKIDCLILDPPRDGSTFAFIKAIAKMNIKRIVYVSCGPESLIRDLKIFNQFNYEVKDVYGVDLFSRTDHVETVALLTRKDSVKK